MGLRETLRMLWTGPEGTVKLNQGDLRQFLDASCLTPEEYTYSELAQIATDGDLVPGQQYMMTDFKQETYDGATPDEKIILFAKSTNTFYDKVFSVDYNAEYILDFSQHGANYNGLVLHCKTFDVEINPWIESPKHFLVKNTGFNFVVGTSSVVEVGFVIDTGASVSENSKVDGISSISTGSLVSDRCSIHGSIIRDGANVSNRSEIYLSTIETNSTVSSGSKVRNSRITASYVQNYSTVYGNSVISGSSTVQGKSHISDESTVSGNSNIELSTVSGSTVLGSTVSGSDITNGSTIANGSNITASIISGSNITASIISGSNITASTIGVNTLSNCNIIDQNLTSGIPTSLALILADSSHKVMYNLGGITVIEYTELINDIPVKQVKKLSDFI